MAKHTPGPWVEFFPHIIKAQGVDAPICRVNWGGKDFGLEESSANARLIASAPELFEMVKHYLALCKTLGYSDRQVDKLTKIIAKVEGRE